ncbi:hypothetical protein HYDPIDRAFT_167342 [Hydnomerulius pinastri MD-312]|uniref:CN hydrolase domain-containing protein n=1 Tax=Hydnomerulius pinastri MD-312 TaxID=994086 RepID=A0A0C9WAJ9_9AGAM|nr:hypothetical protein HYDPIDRAFT_167342 [Hydnomerulius pinastri MD-312]
MINMILAQSVVKTIFPHLCGIGALAIGPTTTCHLGLQDTYSVGHSCKVRFRCRWTLTTGSYYESRVTVGPRVGWAQRLASKLIADTGITLALTTIMAGSLQAFILTEHPTPFFATAEFGLSCLALGPSPRFIPLVLLLSVLRIHGQRIAFRHTRGRELLFSWICITAGSSLAHWASAANALSSPAQSLTAIALLSAVTYLHAVLALYLDIRTKGRVATDWAQLTLFPALWATVWSVASHVSPVGRLLNWSPVSGSHSYNWIVPYVGPTGIDWIVAAWAVVCSEVAALWLMGFEEYEPLGVHGNGKFLSRRSKGLLVLGSLLLALTLPSFASNNLPVRADIPADATALKVGCALPHPLDGSHPTLDDFIDETKRMTAAKIILWPESAVIFNSVKEREAAFAKVRGKSAGSFVGVAFEEYVVDDPAHPSSSRTRNGLALIHMSQKPGDEVIQYYKRNLVPLTESFSKIPSIDPPEINRLLLTHPNGITAPDWAPAPNFTRPIPITSSVCLDFASPSAFTSLDSRPALILAPARTWDTTVGLAMWEQAKTRADELGSMVLWCDGGVTGVSGVGGGGIHEIMQVGGGSWMRTIGVPYPFNESRTLYARTGDFTVLVFLVALMGGGIAGNYLLVEASHGAVATLTGGRFALRRIPFIRRMIAPAPAEADLLGAEEVGEQQNLLG